MTIPTPPTPATPSPSKAAREAAEAIGRLACATALALDAAHRAGVREGAQRAFEGMSAVATREANGAGCDRLRLAHEEGPGAPSLEWFRLDGLDVAWRRIVKAIAAESARWQREGLSGAQEAPPAETIPATRAEPAPTAPPLPPESLRPKRRKSRRRNG